MPWNYGRQEWWKKMLASVGSVWVHDGSPTRPYALLTNVNPKNNKKRISNAYFDGAKLAEHPKLLYRAAADLADQLSRDERERVDIACGSPFGSITLAYAIAYVLSEPSKRMRRNPECLAWFTEPGEGKELTLKRFGPSNGRSALVVDDAFTTGGTSERSAAALERDGATVMPVFLYIINRPGVETLNGRRIISLVGNMPEARVWDEGENPFTPGGAELVPPVRPKYSWVELTAPYANTEPA